MKKTIWPANIIFDIGEVLFQSAHGHPRYKEDPCAEPAPGIFNPIHSGLDILRDCARIYDPETKEPIHKLFILSNWNDQNFTLLKKEYQDVFNLFSGIVISGQLSFKKPDPRIYQLLLDQYRLHPGSSIFIDDFSYNVAAAQQLGITGIHHACPKNTRKQLELLGVLHPNR